MLKSLLVHLEIAVWWEDEDEVKTSRGENPLMSRSSGRSTWRDLMLAYTTKVLEDRPTPRQQPWT